MASRLESEVDDIWADDLLDRRVEAEMLEAYLESAARRDEWREDKRAFTLAVDAGYGQGKTFFLKRLARHLGTRHPVALVDAWSDDMTDQPLTAIAATLKQALDPIIDSVPSVRQRWVSVLAKTGTVAGIAAKGLLKRAAGLAFTSAAVEASGEVLSGVSEDVGEAISDDLKTLGQDSIQSTSAALTAIKPSRLMEDRIASFNEGKEAIAALKRSLADLVKALEGQPLTPPIVIVIDELDRCRPTYAVNLLEEIKHLFDVHGLVFIFGMHGDQLAHSVAGAYGPGFDGRAYLRRFINREYRLKEPDLAPLLAHLVKMAGLVEGRLQFEPVLSGRDKRQPPAHIMIAGYMNAYNLAARDAFLIIDILQTCVALTKNPLLMGLLLPLVIARISGLEWTKLPEPSRYPFHYFLGNYDVAGRPVAVNLHAHARGLSAAAALSTSALIDRINHGDDEAPARIIFETRTDGRTTRDPLSDPARYPELLETVGRFSNPESASTDAPAAPRD